MFLGVLIGAIAATAILLTSGARRTATAHERFLESANAYDVGVGTYCRPVPAGLLEESEYPLSDRCHDELAKLPAVSEAATLDTADARIETLDGRSIQPDPLDDCYSGPGDVTVLSAGSGDFGRSLNRRRFVAGRDADPSVADEAVISQETAARLDLGVGDRLRVQFFGEAGCDGSPVDWSVPTVVRIVGVQLSPGEVRPPSGFYTQWLEVSPTLLKDNTVKADPYLAVRVRPGATVADFHDQAKRAGLPVVTVTERSESERAVEEAVRPSVTSLALLAALTVLAAAAVLGQLVSRHAASEADEDDRLRALGMGRRDRAVLGALRGGAVALLAAVFAVGLAVALSPTMPIGIARGVEPQPGIAFDGIALGFGALVVVVFVVAVATVSTLRAGRPRRQRGPIRFVSTVSAWLPPTVASGLRSALGRKVGSAGLPVLSGFGTLAIGVAAIVGALTFAAGLSHLQSTPRLLGWNWDLALLLPEDTSFRGATIERTDDRVRRAFADEPVVAYSPGTVYTPFPNSRPLELGPEHLEVNGLMAFDGAAPLGPSLIAGHKPRRRDEIVLGPETLAALHLAIGDKVQAFGQEGSWEKPGKTTSEPMRIVGTAITPLSDQLGRGAAMTFEGLTRLNSGTDTQAYLVRIAPDARPETVIAAFKTAFSRRTRDSVQTLGYSRLADPALNIEAIDAVPEVFALLAGLMSLAVLAHLLLVATRARRKELAILRVLGFSRRATALAVGWNAVIDAALALLIGIPIGLLAGRFGWRVYATGLGVVPEAVTPWPLLALTALAALAIAVLVSLPPAIRAARASVGVELRSE